MTLKAVDDRMVSENEGGAKGTTERRESAVVARADVRALVIPPPASSPVVAFEEIGDWRDLEPTSPAMPGYPQECLKEARLALLHEVRDRYEDALGISDELFEDAQRGK